MFPWQDIREGQSQKTLAYAQALQYWVENSNSANARPTTPFDEVCMLELKRVMEPYVAFSNKAILEGATPWGRSLEVQTWATIPMKTQSAPIKEHTEVAALTKESTEVLAPMEVSAEELAALLAAISGPVGEPNVSP